MVMLAMFCLGGVAGLVAGIAGSYGLYYCHVLRELRGQNELLELQVAALTRIGQDAIAESRRFARESVAREERTLGQVRDLLRQPPAGA